MKKILIIAAFVAVPAIGACLITGGACNSWDPASPMENKYVPSYLQDFYKPDYMEHIMQPEIQQPIKVTPHPTGGTINLERESYDANCQFGICLPSN